MISRSAFAQLHHSVLLLIGTVLGLALTFHGPAGAGDCRARAGRRAGRLRLVIDERRLLPRPAFYRRSPLWAPLLPAIVASIWARRSIRRVLLARRRRPVEGAAADR